MGRTTERGELLRPPFELVREVIADPVRKGPNELASLRQIISPQIEVHLSFVVGALCSCGETSMNGLPRELELNGQRVPRCTASHE